MIEVLLDTILDALKILPFLFIAYLIIELIENKAGDKTTNIIKKSGKFGPVLGGLLGIVPQCGFSAAAANLYAGKIISIGTIIAVFLSTSDEMLPILISEAVPADLIIKILLIKVIISIVVGLIVDFIFRKRNQEINKEELHKICDDEHCHCEEEGIIKASITHTLHILLYIFIISLILNTIIHLIGEENIANLVLNVPILGPIVASIIGLIPNCASSVILTQVYLQNIISVGSMIAGLLVNAGIGLLVLFKVNKSKKENFCILGILYFVAVISGILIDLIL